MREADLDDIEDMNKDAVRKLLVEHGLLKARKEDNIDRFLVDEKEIHAENSIYLFPRKSCFRRHVHFI